MKTILILEDEKDILQTLSELLKTEGYEVQTAQNGKEALAFLKTSSMPDLILLDMKMPVMNGWDFTKEFYRLYDHRSPLLIMTAAADAEQRAKEVNASGFIGKPFDLEDLLTKIKAALLNPNDRTSLNHIES